MANLPSSKGQIVFAANDNVASYKTASPNTPQFGGSKTKGNNGINWAQGDTIGTYTGISEKVGDTTWYKIEYVVYHRNRFLGIGNKYSLKPGGSAWSPQVGTSYFKDSDISVAEVTTKDAEEKENRDKANKELQDLIDKLLNEKDPPTVSTNKGFFASIFGPTVDSGTDLGGINRNTLIGIAGILILAIIGIVAYKRSKRSKDGLPAVSYRKDGLPAVSTRQPPRSTSPQTLGNRKRN